MGKIRFKVVKFDRVERFEVGLVILEVGEKSAKIGKVVFDGERGEFFSFEEAFELSQNELGIIDGLRLVLRGFLIHVVFSGVIRCYTSLSTIIRARERSQVKFKIENEKFKNIVKNSKFVKDCLFCARCGSPEEAFLERNACPPSLAPETRNLITDYIWVVVSGENIE